MTGLELKAYRKKLGMTRNTVNRWEIGIYPISDMAVRLLNTMRPKKRTRNRPGNVAS
jgi:DNA-binding transcriptional regulator YiaG